MNEEDLSQGSEILHIKEWGPNFWGNQFRRMSDLFGPPFGISILNVLQTQILRLSLDFSPFSMNKEDFSQGPETLQIKEWGLNFWGEPILQNV